MRKYLLLFTTLATFLLVGCSNEEETDSIINEGQHLEVNADFIKLVDDSTHTAGELSILTHEPEVTITWNSSPDFNIDTTVTTIPVRNGKATLPIQWSKIMEDGKYGPSTIAYRAGVQITAGNYTKYVPLYWAEKIDSTKVLKSQVQTRAAGNAMPRLAQISLLPAELNMSDQKGGVMAVTISDLPFVIMDISDIRSNYNIDVSKFEPILYNSTVLNFNWTSAGHPNFGFTARVVFMAEELIVTGAVIYNTSGGGSSELAYQSSNLPSAIPWPGGTYTFTFTGSYTGGLQVRSMVRGVQDVAGPVVYNKQPYVTVSANRTYVTRDVTFQYRRAGQEWLPLPTSTNRIQHADP